MKKSICKKAFRVVLCGLLLLCLLSMVGCNSSNAIVGSWVEEDGDEVLTFDRDGSCSVPFAYNSAWIESVDHYAITSDGTLALSSSGGHANYSFEKTNDKDEALDDDDYYYLSGKTLIINESTYLKS